MFPKSRTRLAFFIHALAFPTSQNPHIYISRKPKRFRRKQREKLSMVISKKQSKPSCSLLFLILLLRTPSHIPTNAQRFEDPQSIDMAIKDIALKTLARRRHKTAVVYNLSMPPTIAGVAADAARYRTGSLRRHGAILKEFRLHPGVTVRPHTKRLILVRQNLGNISSSYSHSRKITGYQFISPALGLLLYSSNNQSELEMVVTKKPMHVDFAGVVHSLNGQKKPVCLLFELEGKVSLLEQSSPYVCVSRQQGHFVLAIPVSEKDCNESERLKKAGRWKVVLASTVAGVFVAVLLGLMVIAMANVTRKRLRRAERERRAYEEEALQISMVGHVRAPMAPVARTAPSLEDEHSPSL